MLYINNLAEINHIKSFNVPITQPHILMKSIQMATILDFAQSKNPLRVTFGIQWIIDLNLYEILKSQ